MKKTNYILASIILIISGYFIFTASKYPKASAYGTGVPGPGLWPIFVASLMALCALLLIVKTAINKKSEDAKDGSDKKDEDAVVLFAKENIRVYITMAILAIYCILLKPVGFIISTVVMMSVFVQWFYRKKIYITIIISVVVTLVVYSLFKFVLNVPIGFGLFYF